MDILSSQANLAGYKAVIESFANFEKAIPMMMTAAGTVPAAKILVVGAGVAGLQAIATAKRMGGIVFATDVRTVVAAREILAAFVWVSVPQAPVFGQFSLKRHGAGFGARKTASNPY